jgi:hypothetical protein
MTALDLTEYSNQKPVKKPLNNDKCVGLKE